MRSPSVRFRCHLRLKQKGLRDLFPKEPQIRMKWISEPKSQLKFQRMASWLGVSKSGYYMNLKPAPSKRSQENSFLLVKVKEVFEQGRKYYGSPRITAGLRQQGYTVSQNRVARIMRENEYNGFKSFATRGRGENMEAGLVLSAMNMALKRRNATPGLLFHSDRGSQYASQMRNCLPIPIGKTMPLSLPQKYRRLVFPNR